MKLFCRKFRVAFNSSGDKKKEKKKRAAQTVSEPSPNVRSQKKNQTSRPLFCVQKMSERDESTLSYHLVHHILTYIKVLVKFWLTKKQAFSWQIKVNQKKHLVPKFIFNNRLKMCQHMFHHQDINMNTFISFPEFEDSYCSSILFHINNNKFFTY